MEIVFASTGTATCTADELAKMNAETGLRVARFLGWTGEVVPRNVGGQRVPDSYILRVKKEGL